MFTALSFTVAKSSFRREEVERPLNKSSQDVLGELEEDESWLIELEERCSRCQASVRSLGTFLVSIWEGTPIRFRHSLAQPYNMRESIGADAAA
jgi:hypothetical protein